MNQIKKVGTAKPPILSIVSILVIGWFKLTPIGSTEVGGLIVPLVSPV
jgi:hypothetical protein